MRKYIIIALILVVLGIGASLLLIPSQSDTEQAKSRDQQTVDIGNIDVEAEYNQGRRSYIIVAALADKRVAEGNRPAAIALLEEYIKTNPNDAQGHKKLAEQYMLANRQADYNAQIMALGNLEPTEENLHILSFIYNGDKNYPKQAETLQKIIDVTKGEKPQYYIDLATIKLLIGDKDGALATLDALKTTHPDYNDYSVERIRISILNEKGQTDAAFAEAKQWIDRPKDAFAPPPATAVPPQATATAQVSAVPTPASRQAEELADFCNIFHYGGHADKAVELVEPHLDLIDSSTTLAVAYVNASITAGKSDAAYAVLQKIDAAGKMTPELAVPYLELALKRDDKVAAKHIAQTVNLPSFNEEQTLDLIEMARASNANDILGILLSRVNTPEMLKDKPVLSAVVGILGNTSDQDKRVNTALGVRLSSVQRLRLAEACARANKKSCFDTIAAQYPPVDKMTTPQITEYAQLYIIAHRPGEVIKPIALQAAKPDAHPEVVHSYIRLAAANGDESVLKPWLTTNAATMPLAQLQDLFFLASDHHHPAAAVEIAERLYARDPSPMNRDILVAAYNNNGQPEKSLPLMREALKSPGTDDNQYIAALSQLARKDPSARKELVEYVEAALKAGKGDDRTQLNYVYILLNNGERTTAIAYAKANAESRGGEWKKLYLQLTSHASNAPVKKLSREERLAMVNNPRISNTNKREIAFSLLHDGYKDDAIGIFQQMAAHQPPDSQPVKELLFLWGGKLNHDQMAWVHAQAASASPYDKQKWAEVINNYGDDRSVLEYVSATPDALYNKNLRQKYFRVLAERGNKQDFDDAMRNWVAQTTDVAALSDYAAAAQAHNYREAALNANQRIVQLDPNNAKALSTLAALNLAKGTISQADMYTDRALQAQQSHPSADVDDSANHFTKAQLLKQKGQTAAAQAEFQIVIQEVQQSGSKSPLLLSRMYTAQFNVGQGDAAIQGYRQLLANDPDNKAILADYMSSLIEHKYYDEATRVANQFDKTSPYYGRSSALVGHSPDVAAIEPMSNGREMKISFNAPLEQSPFDEKKLQQLAWIEHTETGYDSVTISAKPGLIVRFEPTAQDAFVVVPQQSPAAIQQAETQRQEDLRLQMLYAQIEINTGQPEKAQQRLAILDQYYPNDPQLLSFEGSIASSTGHQERATQLLQQAVNQAPANEGYQQQLYDVTHVPPAASYTPAGQDYVMLDHEYRRYGSPTENITSLTGQVAVQGNNALLAHIANDYINPKKLVSPGDGLPSNDQNYTKPEHGNRQYADISLSHFFDDASTLTGSLFFGGQASDNKNDGRGRSSWIDTDTVSNDGTVGLGLAYAMNTPLGRSEVFAEYNRPYWDYAWAAYFNAKRDRVGVRDSAQLTKTTSLGVEAALNNYSIDPMDVDNINGNTPMPTDDLVQSGLFRLSLTHQLQAQSVTQPYFGIAYAMDGEYALNSPDYHTSLQHGSISGTNYSTTYHPFDFYQHETHSLQGLLRYDFTPTTHAAANGGWTYDRINEQNGPIIGGSLDQDITSKASVGVRGQYSRVVDESGGDGGVDLGADLKYKF